MYDGFELKVLLSTSKAFTNKVNRSYSNFTLTKLSEINLKNALLLLEYRLKDVRGKSYG